MKDQFNREIEYLRISVTDRCNFRCKYCMPKDGVPQIDHSEILTYDEIVRLVKEFAKCGISKIKITGGEPLVRRDLPTLIRELKKISGIEEVTLTTNGYNLADQIDHLIHAGIDGINISLDTLNREKFEKITGVDGLKQVLSGINLCLLNGIKTKINVVCLKDYNFDEIIDFAELARDNNLAVRFIELMPLGLGKDYFGYRENEIKSILEAKYEEPNEVDIKLGNGPATYYHFSGFKGTVGYISAFSSCFCEKCNRVRMSASGMLKLCLYSDKTIDLKAPLREGATDKEMLEIIKDGIYKKPERHLFGIEYSSEKNNMNEIGG